MEWNYYYFVPRTHYNQLDWVMTQTGSGQEDCDIYLKASARPTLWSWDYSNVSIGTVSTINQTMVATGVTYYFGVYGYQGCSFSIKVHGIAPVNPSDCPNQCSLHSTTCTRNQCTCKQGYSGSECEQYDQNLNLNTNMTGFVGDNAWNYYHIFGQTVNTLVVNVIRTSETGDPDVYIKSGSNPSRMSYQYLDISTNSNIVLSIPNPLGQTWYIGIYGWKPCEYNLFVIESSNCDCNPNGHGHCDPGSTICICDIGWVGDGCDSQTSQLTSGIPTKNNLLRSDQWVYYMIHADQSSAFSLTLREQNTTGYIWVFINHNEFPSLTSYDYSDKNSHSAVHEISYYTKNQQSGDIFIGVYGSPYIPSSSSSKGTTAAYDLVVWLSDF